MPPLQGFGSFKIERARGDLGIAGAPPRHAKVGTCPQPPPICLYPCGPLGAVLVAARIGSPHLHICLRGGGERLARDTLGDREDRKQKKRHSSDLDTDTY